MVGLSSNLFPFPNKKKRKLDKYLNLIPTYGDKGPEPSNKYPIPKCKEEDDPR